MIISAVASGIQQSGVVEQMRMNVSGGNPSTDFTTFGITYFVTIISSLFASLMISIVTLESVRLYVEHGTDYTVEMVWAETRKDFLRLFFANIGIFLVVLVSMLFLIIPGIYFAVVCSLLTVAIVQERSGFFKSLKRVMKLIGGSWWLTFGLLIVFGIIIMILAMIVSIPQTALTFWFMFHGMEDLGGTVVRTLFILSGIVYSFVYVIYSIPTIGMYVHFFSLVEKNEGQGLLEKIEEI